jgi:Asp-tRNA(Asn)/Glu-tRNA(Gln) amidotransferase A subunit family amidase
MDAAASIAARVRDGTLSARGVAEQCLARIEATDGRINAFSARLAERALKRAEAIDAHPQRHKMPLAGVPFAVKNLFDRDPVLVGNGPDGNNTPAYPQTNRSLYDTFGRVFRVGLRVKY